MVIGWHPPSEPRPPSGVEFLNLLPQTRLDRGLTFCRRLGGPGVEPPVDDAAFADAAVLPWSQSPPPGQSSPLRKDKPGKPAVGGSTNAGDCCVGVLSPSSGESTCQGDSAGVLTSVSVARTMLPSQVSPEQTVLQSSLQALAR